jgi:hypothetical protein
MTGNETEQDPAANKPLWKKVGWLIVIWSGSVVALGIAAEVLRMFMTAAGMKSH